jgi:transcriptional regulator
MYLPKHFEETDRAALYEFIAAHSFAALVSTVNGSLFATHLPLLLDHDDDGNATLIGHVARGNKHQLAFDSESESLAIFQGAHAYVSPLWYAESPAVPTWNYSVVHAYGRPQMVEDEEWLSALVDRLTAHFDPAYSAEVEFPPEYKAGLLKGIVGFRMPVDRMEGKYKLSQNRSEADQRGVIEALQGHEVALAMHSQLNRRAEET